MTSFMRDSFIFIAESASLIWLLKITLILAVSLLILKFGRSARASLRHLLLTCTFAVILLLPAATLVSPPLRVEVPDSKVHSTELAPANQGLVATAFEQNARTNTTARSPFSYKFSVPQILWLVWSLGAGLVLFKLVVSLCRLRAVRRSAMPSLEINQALQQLANDAAVRRRIEVLLHDAVDVPLTYGLFRPVILLPLTHGPGTRRNCVTCLCMS